MDRAPLLAGAGPAPLPEPRGELTERLFAVLRAAPHRVDGVHGMDALAARADEDELHLALYGCYELHYAGWRGVDPEWEWEPSLLGLRRDLEASFLDDIMGAVGAPLAFDPEAVVDELWAMATSSDGPSLSSWMRDHASLGHVREFAIHRSAYQRKEADPHTWALPRLEGEAKAVMLSIQADEYGNGDVEATHAVLFGDTMTALGLDPTPNHYVGRLPGTTLATTNLISLLGLHRRWRGALVGHLALFEMTSVGPMGRYAETLRRMGFGDDACRFYDVHVEADEVHQHLAADGMVGGLLRREPELAGDVLFGARALGAVERRFACSLMERWERGESSLRCSRHNGMA